MTVAFEDRSLSCRECGNAFVWTAGEQEFYQQKGLLHEPQRCPDCRKKAKAERAAARSANMHDVICSNCGKPAQVPFEPRTDRPVYCSECFEARRNAPPPPAAPPA
jgi:CxxC-x17-CxxC domain-containing protein